jgi:hypothetical protein
MRDTGGSGGAGGNHGPIRIDPAAFPAVGHGGGGGQSFSAMGLSRRELLAMVAMHSLADTWTDASRIAVDAVATADALIAELERTKK